MTSCDKHRVDTFRGFPNLENIIVEHLSSFHILCSAIRALSGFSAWLACGIAVIRINVQKLLVRKSFILAVIYLFGILKQRKDTNLKTFSLASCKSLLLTSLITSHKIIPNFSFIFLLNAVPSIFLFFFILSHLSFTFFFLSIIFIFNNITLLLIIFIWLDKA